MKSFREFAKAWTRVLLVSTCLNQSLLAGIFYVDFRSGSDANAGTDVSAPWKHCPGDPAAVSVPGAKILSPGDTVAFKGGVEYQGCITINGSGVPGNPVVLAGDIWGPGRAILDNTAGITTVWKRCVSAADCRGNSNWSAVWWTAIPPGVSNCLPQMLCNGTNFCAWAQDPNPRDCILWEDLAQMRIVAPSNLTLASIRDPSYFTNSDASFYAGTYAVRWVYGNELVVCAITNYSPASNTIFTAPVEGIYSDRNSYYALIGHVQHIDVPGEWAVSLSEKRLYLWPVNGQDPNSQKYSVARSGTAFYGPNRHDFVIKGFDCRGYYQEHSTPGYSGMFLNVASDSQICNNILIQSNQVYFLRSFNRAPTVQLYAGTNVVFSGNAIHDCWMSRGIIMGGRLNRVENNRFYRLTGTGIHFPGALDSVITSNVLTDIIGIHANGLSVYQSSSNITVTANIISNVPSLFTFENSKDLSFINNLADANGQDQRISEWGGCSGWIRFLCNTLVNNPKGAILMIGNSGTNANYQIQNNIISGGGGKLRSQYNVWTSLAYYQSPSYQWALGSGEIVASNPQALFRDPSSHDWRLAVGSPARRAGTNLTNLGITNDILGAERGNSWDIGAFQSPAPRPIAPGSLRVPGN